MFLVGTPIVSFVRMFQWHGCVSAHDKVSVVTCIMVATTTEKTTGLWRGLRGSGVQAMVPMQPKKRSMAVPTVSAKNTSTACQASRLQFQRPDISVKQTSTITEAFKYLISDVVLDAAAMLFVPRLLQFCHIPVFTNVPYDIVYQNQRS